MGDGWNATTSVIGYSQQKISVHMWRKNRKNDQFPEMGAGLQNVVGSFRKAWKLNDGESMHTCHHNQSQGVVRFFATEAPVVQEVEFSECSHVRPLGVDEDGNKYEISIAESDDSKPQQQGEHWRSPRRITFLWSGRKDSCWINEETTGQMCNVMCPRGSKKAETFASNAVIFLPLDSHHLAIFISYVTDTFRVM